MTHGSLFSGLGGFDLAAEWIGWKNIFHCENNPFAAHILNHYWPNAKSYEDIKKTDFTTHRGQIDVLTGGFPCQPFSVAGNRKGEEDDRYLWPEMCRAIDECRPVWVIGENVAGIVSMVQPEGTSTVVEAQTDLFGTDSDEIIKEEYDFTLRRIIDDLEERGFEVQPVIIPAAALGAPHRRDRIWIIGYSGQNAKYRAIKNRHKNGWRSLLRKERTKIGKFGITRSGDHEWVYSNTGETGTTRHTKHYGPSPSKIGRGKQKSSITTWTNKVRKSTRTGSVWAGSNSDSTDPGIKEMCEQTQCSDGSVAFTNASSPRCERGAIRKGDTKTKHNGTERYDHVSHTYDQRCQQQHVPRVPKKSKFGHRRPNAKLSPNAHIIRLGRKINRNGKSVFVNENVTIPNWRNFPTQSPICGGNDGISHMVDHVALPSRIFGTRVLTKEQSFLKIMMESIKGYGNAIVPQVALEIFEAIEKIMKNTVTRNHQ